VDGFGELAFVTLGVDGHYRDQGRGDGAGIDIDHGARGGDLALTHVTSGVRSFVYSPA